MSITVDDISIILWLLFRATPSSVCLDVLIFRYIYQIQRHHKKIVFGEYISAHCVNLTQQQQKLYLKIKEEEEQ